MRMDLPDSVKNRYLVYFVFAKEFGYTPSQVDSLPLSMVVFFVEKLREEKERVLESIGRDWY